MSEIEIKNGDCFELIKQVEDNSIDLVVTSPPYSDIVNYGKNVDIKHPNDYCDWILPLFKEIYRVLKPSGSFILNINDRTINGYRSTYIFDLISRNNKETKLKLYDTYIWHKKSAIPNGGPKRFRNNTEYIFHFCKDAKKLKFYMDRVMEEPKNSTKNRIEHKVRYKKNTDNGVQNHTYRNVKIDKVRPENIFRFSTAGASRDNIIKHPAPFHKELPSYFINLLTDENDIVMDPFSGIGTTGLACKELNRNYIGYELNKDYTDFSIKRINNIENDFLYVVKCDLDGNELEYYNNPTDAGIKNNLNRNNISNSIRGMKGFKNFGGFIWKLKSINNIENDFLYVVKCDLDGNELERFNNYSEASQKTGLRKDDILRCCRSQHNHKTHGGFTWKLKK